MPTLDDLVGNSARVVKTFPSGAALTIDYCPTRVTRKTFADLTAFSEMNEDRIMDNLDALIDIIASLVKWWDLTEPDGSMIAITTERLNTVPLPILTFVAGAITGDIRPEAMALQAK